MTDRQFVRCKYPTARLEYRLTGAAGFWKDWYEIKIDTGEIVGRGKIREEAWKSAKDNIKVKYPTFKAVI